MSLALVLSLAACSGGNPFETGGSTGGGGGGGGIAIPEKLASDLDGYTYDPAAGTLTLSGVSFEGSPFTTTYRRRAALDRGGYQAFTAQDGSLDRHATAYVRNIRGTSAVAVMTGGQFEHVMHGGAYSRTSYSAPVPPGSEREGGLVTYAGNYVGMLNGAGSGEDLLPINRVDPDVDPTQAAEVTGRVVINASFSDGTVNGEIYDRRITDAPGIAVDNISLAPTAIAADGTFTGSAQRDRSAVGEYGGLFGGTGATEVAGVVHLEEHIDAVNNEFEHGIFVIGACNPTPTPGEDPACVQPNR